MPAQTPPAPPVAPVVTAELLGRIAPSESLLRAIPAGGWTTLVDLATIAGRAAHNIKRDLERLQTAGLVDLSAGKDKPVLSAEAVAGLAAIDALANPVREGPAADTTTPEYRPYVHADLTPNPDQPRKDFKPEALGELAATLLADGQLQNILARPNPHQPGPALQIVGGERRWRALGLLIEYGKIPADHPVKVEVRNLTDAQVDTLALVENMQRQDLNVMEEARAFTRLNKVHGWSTAEIADKVNKDQRVIQQRLSLLALSAEEQRQLEAGEITFTRALEILRARPKPLDLSPVKAMILAEVLAAAAGERPGAYHHKAECAPGAADDAIAASLVSAGFLTIEGPDHFTGKFFARFPDYAVYDRFIGQYPGINPTDRSSGLLAIRAAALGADEAERLDSKGTYAAAWLNGPFALTPEGEAIVEQRRAEQAQNAVRAGLADAERDQQMKRLSEADSRTNDLLAAMAKPRATSQIDGVPDVLDALDLPLPWTFCERRSDGWPGLVAANGKSVWLASHMGPSATMCLKLAMAAMNAAAGHAPAVMKHEVHAADKLSPSTDASAEDFDADREPTGGPEFWTWVAARLRRMHAVTADRAPALALAAEQRLEAEGVTYGDESMSWNLGDAVSIADDFAEDFPDQLGAIADSGAVGEFEEDEDDEAFLTGPGVGAPLGILADQATQSEEV